MDKMIEHLYDEKVQLLKVPAEEVGLSREYSQYKVHIWAHIDMKGNYTKMELTGLFLDRGDGSTNTYVPPIPIPEEYKEDVRARLSKKHSLPAEEIVDWHRQRKVD